MYITEWQADIRLNVQDANGNWVPIGDGNSWTDYQGAELSAKSSKTRPGGMGYEVELGGPGTRSDCTLQIQLSDSVFGQHNFLESRCGKGRAQAIVTFLDDEGAVIPGMQFRVNGKILSAALPNMKFDSGNQAFYKVMLGADEKAG